MEEELQWRQVHNEEQVVYKSNYMYIKVFNSFKFVADNVSLKTYRMGA